MGNRTSLLIKKDNTYLTLFEGNNTMALFWVMLMTPNDLASLVAKLEEYNRLEEAESLPDDFDTSMILSRDAALALAISRRHYVELYYSSLVELFDDWIIFLTNEPSDDNKLYLELSEYIEFYSTIEEFHSDFLNILQKIDNDIQLPDFRNTVSELTGFEGWGSGKFREVSHAYKNLEDTALSDINSLTNSSKKNNSTWSSIKSWLLCIIIGTTIAFTIHYFK